MSEESKRKAPAFQFYADDFLAGTSDMSAEEVGGYIRLLCHQWTKGSIPNDPDRVARIAGLMGSPCVGYVMAKFRISDGDTLKNERLEKVREEQNAFKARQSAAGSNGAAKRWNKCPDNGDPNGDPNGVAIATPMAAAWPEHSQTIAAPMAAQWPEDSSPSPSPKKKKETVLSEWELLSGVEAPECFRTKNCMDAIRLWMQHKTEKGDSYKKTGLKMVLTKWANQFTTAEFPSMVEHAIASNWQGVFRPDRHIPVSTSAKPAPNPNDPTDIRNYL